MTTRQKAYKLFDKLVEVLGKEKLLDELCQAMSAQEMIDNLEHI